MSTPGAWSCSSPAGHADGHGLDAGGGDTLRHWNETSSLELHELLQLVLANNGLAGLHGLAATTWEVEAAATTPCCLDRRAWWNVQGGLCIRTLARVSSV